MLTISTLQNMRIVPYARKTGITATPNKTCFLTQRIGRRNYVVLAQGFAIETFGQLLRRFQLEFSDLLYAVAAETLLYDIVKDLKWRHTETDPNPFTFQEEFIAGTVGNDYVKLLAEGKSNYAILYDWRNNTEYSEIAEKKYSMVDKEHINKSILGRVTLRHDKYVGMETRPNFDHITAEVTLIGLVGLSREKKVAGRSICTQGN